MSIGSKFLSYQQSQLRKGAAANKQLSGNVNSMRASSAVGASATAQQKLLYQHQLMQHQQQQQQASQQLQADYSRVVVIGKGNSTLGDMMNIQGRSTTGPRGAVGGGAQAGNAAMVPGVKYGVADALSGTPNASVNSFPQEMIWCQLAMKFPLMASFSRDCGVTLILW